VSVLHAAPKRLFLGRPMRSSQLSETLLPKKLAMPVFCSDPLSSVAYATEEILLILALAGSHFCTLRGTSRPSLSPSCGGGRLLPADLPGVPERGRRIHCRPRQPRGGGRAGGRQCAAGRLRAHCRRIRRRWSCSDHIGGSRTFPAHRLPLGWFMAPLTLVNLRGVRDSGKAFAVPTYGFCSAFTPCSQSPPTA
jgi:hypothetical protein